MESQYDEIQRLKTERSVLKKGLAKEREEKKRVEQRVEELEIEVRRKNEEVESLEFAKTQLSARVERLMEEASNKSTGWGFWKSGDQELRKSLNALEEDYRIKIEENEMVHMQNFEQKQKYKLKKTDLKKTIGESKDQINQSQSEIGSLSSQVTQLERNVQKLGSSLSREQAALSAKEKELFEAQIRWQAQEKELSGTVDQFKTRFNQKVSFDDMTNPTMTRLDVANFNVRQSSKQTEWINKLMTALQVFAVGDFFSALQKRIEYLTPSSPANYYTILNKIYEHTAKVSDAVAHVVEKLVDLLKSTLECESRSLNISDLQKSKSSFLSSLEEVNYQFDIFSTYFRLYLVAELGFVEDIYDLKPINEEMSELLDEMKRSLEQLKTNLYGQVHPHNQQCLKDRLIESLKRLNNVVGEFGKCWARRVVMDVRYTVSVKSTRVVNDHLLSGIQNLTGGLGHVLTAGTQLINVFQPPNSGRLQCASFLSELRKASYKPGINYNDALINLTKLRESELKEDEQRVEIQNLSHTLKQSRDQTEDIKVLLRKTENQWAVLRCYAPKEEETTQKLSIDTDSISEDVQSGSQRLAMRLSKCAPIENLTTDEGDMVQRIRASAQSKIMQLTIQLNSADKKATTLARNLDSKNDQVKMLVQIRDDSSTKIKSLEKQLTESLEDRATMQKHFEEQLRLISQHVTSSK